MFISDIFKDSNQNFNSRSTFTIFWHLFHQPIFWIFNFFDFFFKTTNGQFSVHPTKDFKQIFEVFRVPIYLYNFLIELEDSCGPSFFVVAVIEKILGVEGDGEQTLGLKLRLL